MDYGRLLDRSTPACSRTASSLRKREWNESERDYQRGKNEKSIAQALRDAIRLPAGPQARTWWARPAIPGPTSMCRRWRRPTSGSRRRAGAGVPAERREFRRKRASGGGTGYNNAGLTTSQIQPDADGPGRDAGRYLRGPETPGSSRRVERRPAGPLCPAETAAGKIRRQRHQPDRGRLDPALWYSRDHLAGVEAMVNRGERSLKPANPGDRERQLPKRTRITGNKEEAPWQATF